MKVTKKLKSEIETWTYLAGTLTQEHQKSVKNEILRKVDNLKEILKDEERIEREEIV